MSQRRSLLVASLTLFSACAQQQPPIDRVQPDYLDKAFFVGADYLDAKDDPEFYSQGTLVDVGYGSGQDGLFTSTYAQPLTRVKWTVQQDQLVARLSYERILNSDGKGTPGKATNDGIIVAAYKIDKHFDIKRSYNAATGEQENVIEENDLDRPWYQRQYIRVDWSQNLSKDNYDYDTLSMIGIYGGVTYSPLAYSIKDPTNADAPHFDAKAGYLDVTSKAFAQPNMIDLSVWGGGMMPACYFDADVSGGTAPAASCAPVELTIRQSFYKVPESDYEPADWDGLRFQAFGAFTTDRSGYARNYGMTDTQLHRFINRYDLWERNHYYADPVAMTGEVTCFTPQTTLGLDPHRDVNADGTEDECATVGGGSRCDTFRQRCTLPFKDRVVKPIAWYFAEGSNPEFFDATARATLEWDVALRSAVMTARYAECKHINGADCATNFPVYNGQQDDNGDAIELATEVEGCRNARAYQGEDCNTVADNVGASRGYSAGVIALAKLPPMLVLCHSPVETGDATTCGAERLPDNLTAADCATARDTGDAPTIATCSKAITARKGDLRYHQVNAITSPQTPSPWGIMVDSNDPLTGQVVASSINIWSHVTDLWSQSVVDMARYIKGELKTADITEGTYVRDWASAAEAATHQGSMPHLNNHDRYDLLAQMTGAKDGVSLQAAFNALKNTDIMTKANALRHELKDIKADALAPSSTKAVYEARRKRALNTPTEAALTTKMMQQFVGGTGKIDSATMTELASPLRGANPTMARELRTRKELALGERGACIMNEAPAPLALANLANVLESKFGKFDPSQAKDVQLARAEKMRKYLAQRAHYGVITHEMGHSIGMRHNFVSSSDAFNYRPQYWQLRTLDGSQTNICSGAGGTDCVGPRYNDPITDTERNNLIPMFMQSSTMDYAGESTQDIIGLGAYDFAAARMFYGDVAPVFKDADFKAGQPKATGALGQLDTFGGILGYQYEIGDPTSMDRANTRSIHYSELQKEFGMIGNCTTVDAAKFKPAAWNEELMGKWDPLLDGLIVSVDGTTTTRCRQLPVDYSVWSSLRDTLASDLTTNAASHAVDVNGQARFPYGFATDRWADLGNLSVYRHDNGADPYELFDFLITQQEVNHIFDNYRRNRATFSVRSASNRTLERYNEKLRDGAKGLGLIANIYRDFAQAQGYDYNGLWPSIASEYFGDNLLASGLGFDHFAKQMARPQAGPHMMGSQGAGLTYEKVLRSNVDTAGNAGANVMIVPNGATGYFGNVAPGGHPLENALSTTQGEYNSEYTVNAGSYYDKAFAAMLMTESVDNFISERRRDFLDARYRSVSLADVFPDGYRRWLGNNLTGDDVIKGVRVASTASGSPLVDVDKYPTQGMGWTSWWQSVPRSCFPRADSLQCDANPPNTVALESQVGWEQQKFLIAWTLMYLPENAQQTWLNQMNIWEVGADSDPGFVNRVQLKLPEGKTYVARTFGKELIFGKNVQKGIGARMLEWGNTLVKAAYVTTDGPDLDGDGTPDWYEPTLVADKPVVKYDPTIKWVTADGSVQTGRPGCNATDNSDCTCTSNKACLDLEKYQELPFFMRQAMRDYGLADPSMKGIY